jgi:hypothetical protein
MTRVGDDTILARGLPARGLADVLLLEHDAAVPSFAG